MQAFYLSGLQALAALLHGEPEAWHSLAIPAHRLADLGAADKRRTWLEHTHALLARLANQVTHLTVRGCATAAADGTSVAQLLLSLPSSGPLAHLLLEHHPLLPPAALEAVQRFPSLARLELHAAQVPEGAASVLAAITQLSSVRLRTGKLCPPLMAALAGLPRLQHLGLEVPRTPVTFGPWLAQFAGRLVSLRVAAALLPGSLGVDLLALSQLTALDLDSAETPLPPLQQLSALSALRALALRDRGGCNHGAVAFPPAPAGFASLQRFRFRLGPGALARLIFLPQIQGVGNAAIVRRSDCLHWKDEEANVPKQSSERIAASHAEFALMPALQAAGVQLRGCSYGPADLHGSGPDVLTLAGLRPTENLAPLLTALMPCGEPCRCLHVVGGQLGAAALQGCAPVLQSLVELRLEGCAADSSSMDDDGLCASWDAVFSRLLRQAPHLSYLAFCLASAWPGGGLPAALASHDGELHRLELVDLFLPTGMPLGPYLAGKLAGGRSVGSSWLQAGWLSL